ncbi:MAG TPA: DUF5818 domain-containing protein [Sphingomonas sp.]
MTSQALSAIPPADAGADACRKTGHFIAKGGCFALHGKDGVDVWLDIDPVPLHMLDQEVEICGRAFGARHIWVEAIGPVGALFARDLSSTDPW